VIFTETNGVDVEVLRCKVIGKLGAVVPEREGSRVIVSFHVFPADKGDQRSLPPADLTWYPDIPTQERSRQGAALLKRMMDAVGSVVGILIFSPVLIAASLLIKLTSQGPVLFRQERVGQYGKKFTFLKFRSMYVNNDESVHREYVQKLIEGTVDGRDSRSGEPQVFKITEDKRVTPIGGILRKTSMDELPQFFNVLRGEMSLVGPRPPIPYEVEKYDIWHRRRVMEIKPGITGLWQVKGRSSTTFDDMVRLDLQYAKEWSIWLDIKILLKTPWAVLRGKGAY
jgi:exopolysaccharide biosynthesis polyprenyl glycosylphosphotransferase